MHTSQVQRNTDYFKNRVYTCPLLVIHKFRILFPYVHCLDSVSDTHGSLPFGSGRDRQFRRFRVIFRQLWTASFQWMEFLYWPVQSFSLPVLSRNNNNSTTYLLILALRQLLKLELTQNLQGLLLSWSTTTSPTAI